MKRLIIIVLFTAFVFGSAAQEVASLSGFVKTETTKTSFKEGEWLKFRIHFGIINAGYATLKLKNSRKKGKLLYHAIGKGWTSGAARMFYEIDDNYESYFTKDTIKPIKFKRRVDEEGYLIRRDLYFDHKENEVTIKDLEKKTEIQVAIKNVQDMVSAFYYVRNIDLSNVQEGDEIEVDLFFDGETYPFKLKFLEKEILKSKFGKIKTWKIRPLVQQGRVFEGQESLTLWVTDDANKLPIRIKADLVVGSLKADLDEFKGLANPFNIVLN
jgi:hypothetical protein